MDSAGLGALLGFSLIVCMVCSVTCFEKGRKWKESFEKRWKNHRALQTPLLVITVANPLLVRSGSKHFKLKEVLPSK